MVDSCLCKFNRVSAIMSNTIKKFCVIFIKGLEKDSFRLLIGQCNSQTSTVHIHPMLQSHFICHFESIFSCMKHKPLVCMGSYGPCLVQHSHMNIAGSDEPRATEHLKRFHY